MSNLHSRINVLWRWLIAACAVVCLSIVPSSFAGVAAAANPPGTLVVYNPTGAQCNCTPVAPSVVAPGFSASNLSQVGMLGSWGNTDVLPLGQIGPSSSINLGQYVSVSVSPSAPTKFETLTYSKQSYLGQGPQNAA